MPHCPLGESSLVPRGPRVSTGWFLLRSSLTSGPLGAGGARPGLQPEGWGVFPAESEVREKQNKMPKAAPVWVSRQVALVPSQVSRSSAKDLKAICKHRAWDSQIPSSQTLRSLNDPNSWVQSPICEIPGHALALHPAHGHGTLGT